MPDTRTIQETISKLLAAYRETGRTAFLDKARKLQSIAGR